MIESRNSSRKKCPDCGMLLPDNAPAGLCPACLFRAGMSPTDVTDGANPDQEHPISAEQYPAVGTRLRYFGDYELHEEIGRGGMGVVYRARQVGLNRTVALKMIRAGKFSSDTEIQRLRIEAEAAAQLDHPGIVPVFEVGEHEGLHYFTMAFIDGVTLSSRLNSGPLPAKAAAELIEKVAVAVAYAHEKGVIHRDIKPGNVLIDRSGQPRISDFGLAKQVTSENELTTTGQILGTPSYMPPEQAGGRSEEIGPVSDIYSLGAVLYALLTGRPPFQAATSVETLRQVIDEQPVAPRRLNPSIPRDLETICLKCLEKTPSARYADAKSLARDLKNFLDGRPITARRTSLPEKCWRWACRRPDLSLTLLALIVLVAFGITAAYLQQVQHDRAQQQARMEGLIQTIEAADFRQLPELIDELVQSPDLAIATEELEKRSRATETGSNDVRIDLATTVLTNKLTSETIESWWSLTLQELIIVRQVMQPLRFQLQDPLNNILQTKPQSPAELHKQLLALGMGLSDSGAGDSFVNPRNFSPEFWDSMTGPLLTLLYENPKEFDAALRLFQPASSEFFTALKTGLQTKSFTAQQRHLAISLMSELQRDSPESIADLAVMIDMSEKSLLERHVARMGPTLIPALTALLNQPPLPANHEGATLPTDAQKILAAQLAAQQSEDAKRRAMAGAWLFHLGRSDLVWPLMQQKPDDSVRHMLIDRMKLIGGSTQEVVEQLIQLASRPASDPMAPDSPRSSQLYALLLLAGNFAEDFDEPSRERLVNLLSELFERHPEPGIHSASGWALNQLGAGSHVAEIEARFRGVEDSDARNWYITSTGSTLAVIRGPITFQMGTDWTDPGRQADDSVNPVTGESSRSDQERLMPRLIGRDFAIGLKEVSLTEFLQAEPEFHENINQFTSPTMAHPANRINWYLAARYCNWLSRKEGLDESEFCFIPDADGNYGEGLTLAENYLHRRGYRMPTEAEWEYVCRAGTNTPRFFGHCMELMPQYVWYADNSREDRLIVPGTLKPNELGLFDVLGNVTEWCIDPYNGRPYSNGEVVPDLERELTADAEAWRIVRGGNLYTSAKEVRASDLSTFRPITTGGHYGIRLAKTLKTYPSE